MTVWIVTYGVLMESSRVMGVFHEREDAMLFLNSHCPDDNRSECQLRRNGLLIVRGLEVWDLSEYSVC